MNERKDILEKVKYIMKESNEIKVNCSKLARQLNCDRRTVSRYIDMVAGGQESSVRQYAKKTDGFEHIIEEKVKKDFPLIKCGKNLKVMKSKFVKWASTRRI